VTGLGTGPKLRLGGYQSETSILTRALRQLGDGLSRIPDVSWDVEVVRDVTAQDKRAVDLLSMVEEGSYNICYFASSYLVGRIPALARFDEPFAVTDRAALFRELDRRNGEELAGEVARLSGYRLLGYWDNGFRHISNRLRPIRHPDDCSGMRIRTLDNVGYRKVLAAVGFTPLVIDVKDLVRAVQSGEVDAQENPLTNTVHFGLHRMHKHLSLTSHFHGVALLLANRAWFNALAPELQTAVLAAARDATIAQRRFAIEEDELCLTRLRQEGVVIVEPDHIDVAAFRAAVAAPR
jgi:TRAP-type C4-dicarboxylate transport system substrate-binding protein